MESKVHSARFAKIFLVWNAPSIDNDHGEFRMRFGSVTL